MKIEIPEFSDVLSLEAHLSEPGDALVSDFSELSGDPNQRAVGFLGVGDADAGHAEAAADGALDVEVRDRHRREDPHHWDLLDALLLADRAVLGTVDSHHAEDVLVVLRQLLVVG